LACFNRFLSCAFCQFSRAFLRPVSIMMRSIIADKNDLGSGSTNFIGASLNARLLNGRLEKSNFVNGTRLSLRSVGYLLRELGSNGRRSQIPFGASRTASSPNQLSSASEELASGVPAVRILRTLFEHQQRLIRSILQGGARLRPLTLYHTGIDRGSDNYRLRALSLRGDKMGAVACLAREPTLPSAMRAVDLLYFGTESDESQLWSFL
jgi:hypothetical protein